MRFDRPIWFGEIPGRTNAWIVLEHYGGSWIVEKDASGEQRRRFVEDLPVGHAPVLLEPHFAEWSASYLKSDPTSGTRSPPSVRTPNGPVADIMAAWSGSLPYEPAMIKSPVAIVRGEWDNLCNDADAAWLLAALTSAPQKTDSKIAQATHLMHLETGREALYAAANAFLSRTQQTVQTPWAAANYS